MIIDAQDPHLEQILRDNPVAVCLKLLHVPLRVDEAAAEVFGAGQCQVESRGSREGSWINPKGSVRIRQPSFQESVVVPRGRRELTGVFECFAKPLGRRIGDFGAGYTARVKGNGDDTLSTVI